MIVDSSVLIIFARAQRLEILLRTVGPLTITREVEEEAIGATPDRSDAQALRAALQRGELKVVAVKRQHVAELVRNYPNLGRGEASVIAGAAERRERTVLLDERVARRAAALEGLEAVGSLGVLARARRKGLLKSNAELASALRDLLSAGLWISPEVVEAFWEGVGGRPG